MRALGMGQATGSRVRVWVALLWLASLLASFHLPAQGQQVALAGCPAAQIGVAAKDATPLVCRRAGKLQHGINASGWFAQADERVDKFGGYTPDRFNNYITDSDLALIKSLGFDHVRLGVNPQPRFDKGEADKTPLFNESDPKNYPRAYMDLLDGAVGRILHQGLAVIIDLHPDPGSPFKIRMKTEDDFVDKVADFWQAFAQHYSEHGKFDHDSVFFEIMNEPEFSDRYRWLGVQMKLAAAIRRGAPSNTIIAAGARWSNDDELVFQEPIRDSNIIYNFHFYEPHIFTHQGADFSTPYLRWLRDPKNPVRYPSTLDPAMTAAYQVKDSDVDHLQVIRYGSNNWGPARIETEMEQAKRWADSRGVPLICNEFGIYWKYANRNEGSDWLHWLTDVTTALKNNGIGWTMWDYSSDSFGLVKKNDKNEPIVDQEVQRVLKALVR
jgi:aryl-phospho-beta-D-glucosidase BglC (GH1 family)